MAFDCSPGWRERYGSSATAGAVCTHLEITGEALDPAASERAVYNLRNAAQAGMGTSAYLDEVQRQTGVDPRVNPRQPASIAPVFLAAAAVVAGGLFVWSRSGRR